MCVMHFSRLTHNVRYAHMLSIEHPDTRERERKMGSETEKADLVEALASLIEQNVVYDGNFIRIECDSHGDAIERVRLARAVLAKATGGAK